MPLFDYPTASEVLDDAGLRPEQVNPVFSSGDVTADLTQKINEAGTVVESRLNGASAPYPWPFEDDLLATAYPSYSESQRTALTTRQKGVAALAVKLLALAFLYGRSGQLSKHYTDKDKEYEDEAERLLSGKAGTPDTGLLGQVSGVVTEQGLQPSDTSFSVAVVRSDGYSELCDEYSRYTC